jgi:hypothetical protein
MTEIILSAEGTPYSPAAAARVFCIVHEVADGHWGGIGTTFRMADIVAFSNPELPQTERATEARRALEAFRADGGAT